MILVNIIIIILRMRHDPNVPIFINQENPKRPYTKAYNRFERYKGANTIKQAKKMGATTGDISFDIARGYIKLSETNDLSHFNSIIMNLLKINNKLVERVEALENINKINNKKINYKELLTTFNTDCDFNTFKSKYNIISNEQFEYLYDNSLLNTMLLIFNNFYNKLTSPIKCFVEKPNIFFIYNESWEKEYNDVSVKNIYNTIVDSIVLYFKDWESSCFEDNRENTLNIYLDVNDKIWCDRKELFYKFKSRLFNDIKISAKSFKDN